MAECFYCGSDKKMTRAHLFQQFIRDALQNESQDITMAHSGIQGQGLDLDVIYRGDIRAKHVKILCQDCNGKWMEPIEQAAAPVLASIMRDRGLPPRSDLFQVAHWAVIVNALATQTTGRFDIPVEHRRAIRYSRTGQPKNFGTHFVWTLDNHPSVTFDSMRFVVGADAEGDEQSVTWFSALHAGPLVMITSEFTLNTMIARELHLSGIESYLGTVESNLLCVPDAIRRGTASPEGLVTPSHHAVQELYRKVVGPNADYNTSSAGNEMVSIDRLQCNPTYGFDYGDTLVDVRASLDLSYLDRVFET
ncbi:MULTISPECIES: hypothetical protein [unclassified Rhodococcus (in: high G+C Gram-positive bacteria)]|uniref:hypothetical protein n=1 Tax=unclassified Rhodococcus (in: high G+C Gram-positive bacteria) TaxID=192944 RepID=UPI00113FD55D|nr:MULTISPECIES: hypothetical protein [unclassified Rhodococcus (in: high G+C Gram-positive bacteria)]